MWRVVARYDVHIGGVNTKAGMGLALNTFYIGGLALKWSELLALFPKEGRWLAVAASLLTLGTIGAIASLFFAIRAVMPYLHSYKSPVGNSSSYHSHVFFDHVAEYPTAGDDMSLGIGQRFGSRP